MLTERSPADKDQSSNRPSSRTEPARLQSNWQPARQDLGLRSKAKRGKKTSLTSCLWDWQTHFDWHTVCINTHVGTHTGTVLNLDVCRWELRWHCALSKENLTCSVNGAGRGRLAINLIRIEDANQPLTAALTLTTWPDLWRPANYLHE